MSTELVKIRRWTGARKPRRGFLAGRSEGEAVMQERQETRELLAGAGLLSAYQALDQGRSSSARDYDAIVNAMKAGGIRRLRTSAVGDTAE